MPARAPLLADATVTKLVAIGQRIRDQRKALKVSAVDAAESAGMSRVTLQRIERGEPSVTIGAYIGAATAVGLGSSSWIRANDFAARAGRAASRRIRPASGWPTTRSSSVWPGNCTASPR